MRILSKQNSDEFLHIQKHLILFTNLKYGIYKKFKTIDDLCSLNEIDKKNGIKPIREKMYKKNSIDDFCQENPFSLKKSDIKIVLSWKNHIDTKGYILRHAAEHTVFLSEKNNCLYGIKSITTDLEKSHPKARLPCYVNTIILPFKDCIIYDAFLWSSSVLLGSNMRADLNEEYNFLKAMHGIYTNYNEGDMLDNRDGSNVVNSFLMIRSQFKSS